MPISIKYFLTIFMILLFVGCASRKYLHPVREIDKTINLPEGSKSISPALNMKIYQNGFNGDLSWLAFPQISYGITNNLCYPMFPFPILQYAVINNNKIFNDTVFIDKFNLSLIGGLTGFSYSNRDGFMSYLFVGFNSKYQISNSFWGNFDFKFLPSFSRLKNEYSFMPDIALGYQFLNNFFATLSYQPGFDYYHYTQYSKTKKYVKHEGRITLGFDLNYYCGIRMYSGYAYTPNRYNKFFIPLGASLIFSW
jgi:hypothetical protein